MPRKFIRQSVILTIICFIDRTWAVTCTYFDSFNKPHKISCTQRCCGDTHLQYCCPHKQLGAIVVGGILGTIVVIIVLVIVIEICKRRCFKPPDHTLLRDTGSARRTYGATRSTSIISTPAQGVAILITPPTPDTEDKNKF